MKKKRIGIIGKGFVGSAVLNGFSANVGCDAETRVYDKDPLRSLNTLEDTVNNSDFVFISVPTPSFVSGGIDLSILENAINDISEVSNNHDTIFLIRSTIIPGTTRALQKIHKS